MPVPNTTSPFPSPPLLAAELALEQSLHDNSSLSTAMADTALKAKIQELEAAREKVRGCAFKPRFCQERGRLAGARVGATEHRAIANACQMLQCH